MTKEHLQEYGPSWRDVHVAIRELANTHQKAVYVVCGRTVAVNTPEKLFFRVVAERIGSAGQQEGQTARGHVWPADQWKTVPGMILALTHELDWALTEEKEKREKQTSF
jgi:hypothetical protein